MLKSDVLKYNNIAEEFHKTHPASIDHTPWRHPYLSTENLRRFRDYSDRVWQFASDYAHKHAAPLKIAFAVNMAQNMHKWAWLADKYGAEVGLFPFSLDQTALSSPEWENFDGEFPNVLDGDAFLKANPGLVPLVPCYRIPMEGAGLLAAYQEFHHGRRQPLLHLLSKSPTLRHEILMDYNGFYPYYQWARALAAFQVIYATSVPLVAYACGKPYCVCSVGGDLQFDCGRGDEYGQMMSLTFNAARFLLVSNPHTLGHSRRLGLTNGVYLPYPMDDSRYSPGKGKARIEWEQRYGRGIYVLMTSRLDREVKGQDEKFFSTLVKAARQRPQLRFIFLAWGNSAAEFRARLEGSEVWNQFIILNPVGKKRLIDYYRSCDFVLDQFVYGYYGTSALEAASIGKPVVMKVRREQYAPLYKDDLIPVFNASTPGEMGKALLTLGDNEAVRIENGAQMRRWLVRNHGEQKTVPLMLALFRLAADQIPLPEDLVNPLWDEESKEENAYHLSCFMPLF